jgi:tetratricopeptide (TPR) repeat protein
MVDRIINDRYRLDTEIGQGGMGTVFRAHDNVLDRDVAVKLMSGTRLGTEGRSRLLVEAQTVAKLKHPNIVTVYDAGEFENQPYVVMEYVQGVTLNEYQPDGLERIIEIARQICAALQHAHEQNIVHRDLKPENVIIEPDGSTRLMDFGLAVSTATRMTEDGVISGTVFYMSPEQAFGYEVTPQSDLYSLGVILYELTTQQLPFEAEDALAVITQHIHAPVVPPRAKNEQIPIQLNDLILSLLNKEPHDRPKSASEVSSLLEEVSMLKAGEAPIQELYVLDRIVRGRIVGRQKEFAEARHLWHKAAAGQGQILLISGEPGIGKTRLMREVITHAEVSGGHALIGDCYAESNAPYNAFAQIIRQALNRFSQNGFEIPDSVLDDLLKLTPDQRYQYPQVQPNPILDPETEQLRLFENVVTFCNLLSDESPLLLVVEDVHWGDSGTLKMLHHLIRRTQKQPVMILVTYREIELKKSRPFNELLLELNRQRLGRRMKLNRLDREQTREMLAAIFAEHITPEFLDGIYHETDGNPFFIEEVCRTLVESGAVYFADGQWDRPEDMAELEIPQGVQIAVETRLSQLPQEQQEILSMASILGREFDFETLMKALNVDEDTLIEALEAAEEAQMIEEIDGKGEVTFSFVHALVPSAITESVRTLRRRKLHRQAAQAIEEVSPTDYEALAYHYGEAGQEGLALKYYTLTGERAAAAFANQDAEGHFLAALDLVDEDSEKAHLLAQIGIAQANQSKYGQAMKTWRKAISLYQMLDDQDKVAELYARSGRAAWHDGDTNAGLEICRQGLKAVEGTPEGPGIARLLAETCRACHFNGLQDESERYGQQALQMAKKLDLPAIQAETLTTLGLRSNLSGEEAVVILRQAVELTETANLPRQAARAHNNLAVQYSLKLGNFTKAFEHMQVAVEIAHQVGDRESELFHRVNLGMWMILQGQLKPVKEMMPALQELQESLTDPGAGGIGLNQLKSNLLTFQGKLDEALHLLQERYAQEHKVGDLQRLRNVLFSMVLISLIRKDNERGKIVCEEMIQIAETGMIPISLSHSLLSMIYSREGEVQKARELLAESLIEAKDPGSEFVDQMFVLWAQTDLNVAKEDWSKAWVNYDALIKLTTEHNLRWYQNWVMVEWADAHLKQSDPGDIEKARQMLKETRKEFEDMGAEGYVSIVEERLKAFE